MKYYLLIRSVQNSPIGAESPALCALGGASIRHDLSCVPKMLLLGLGNYCVVSGFSVSFSFLEGL